MTRANSPMDMVPLPSTSHLLKTSTNCKKSLRILVVAGSAPTNQALDLTNGGYPVGCHRVQLFGINLSIAILIGFLEKIADGVPMQTKVRELLLKLCPRHPQSSSPLGLQLGLDFVLARLLHALHL